MTHIHFNVVQFVGSNFRHAYISRTLTTIPRITLKKILLVYVQRTIGCMMPGFIPLKEFDYCKLIGN